MPTYFHGWRRKIGVMTLVLACVFVLGWARSQTVIDVITLPSTMSRDRVLFCGEFSSGFQEIAWTITELEWDEYIPVLNLEWQSGPIELLTSQDHLSSNAPWDHSSLIHRDWNFGSFRFANSEIFSQLIGRNLRGRTSRIPYWSIVIPLTLLSAYLLLSKPRVAKRAAPKADSLS